VQEGEARARCRAAAAALPLPPPGGGTGLSQLQRREAITHTRALSRPAFDPFVGYTPDPPLLVLIVLATLGLALATYRAFSCETDDRLTGFAGLWLMGSPPERDRRSTWDVGVPVRSQ
jgi:hypothetical protein